MRPRTLLRIARWESTKGLGGIDRGAVAVAVAAVAFVLAVGAVAVTGGVALEDGIYRVGVSEDAAYHDPVAADPTFAAVDTDGRNVDTGPPTPAGDGGVAIGGFRGDGRIDLYVEERAGRTEIYVAFFDGEPTEKGLAALAALRTSVGRYNDALMRAEDNRTAAFPVTVSIRFLDRSGTVAAETPGDGGGDRSGSAVDGGNGGADAAGGIGDGATGTGESGGMGGDTAVDAASFGAFDLFGTSSTTGSPSDIRPPFPFQSLVLAFLFVLPLNFLIQAYGSSMLSERLNRRGELLLVAPVGRGEIVVGKTLPYLAAALGITAAIVGGLWLLGSGGGPLSVLAVVPLALLFFGTTFLAAMFARSFKELTFLTVTISTLLTTYAFVPAIFAETSQVAFVSPLTLVIMDLTHAEVSAGEIAFSLGPATLVAVICFSLGFGIYREEDLFTQRPVHLKTLDALASRIHRPRSVALVVALLVPFVFVAELLAVAVLFALPVTFSIPLIFGTIAVIEELAKGIPIYAGYVHARYGRTLAVAAAVGSASGIGFFLAEKMTLAIQFVGLPGLAVADAAFQTGLGAGDPAIVALLVLAPLALHVVTATLTAIGASRGRRLFGIGLGAAILVHLAYNVAVVSTVV
jgi:ABC-type Na+ efflux pump permease subunit